MIKAPFYLLLLISSLACNIGSQKNKNVTKTDTLGNIVMDSGFLENKDKTVFDIFIQGYVDSVDNAAVNGIPAFLADPQFDYHNVGILSPAHRPLPLRKLIVDKSTNCKSLALILSNKSAVYKKKPMKQDDIDVKFIEFSFFELIQMRYQEIGCSSNR